MRKLNIVKFRQRLYRFGVYGVYPVILIIFVLLALLQGYTVSVTREKLQEELGQRDRLQSVFDRYRSNAKISEAQRLAYGTIIKMQVPRSNDVFDVFSLIDAFLARTSIELHATTDPSMGRSTSTATASTESSAHFLTGSATMDDATLGELLRIYAYEFRRFMTLDRISVDSIEDSSRPLYRVELTFQIYDMGGTAPGSKQVFAPGDLARFERYMQDTNIDIYYELQQATPSQGEYEKSGTIF